MQPVQREPAFEPCRQSCPAGAAGLALERMLFMSVGRVMALVYSGSIEHCEIGRNVLKESIREIGTSGFESAPKRGRKSPK